MQIDHCLAGGGLEVMHLATGRYVGSDHFPLEVELRLAGTGPAGGEEVTASRSLPTSRR